MVADVNEEDLGIRTFQLRKGRAVERAIEKIRHNLGAEWRQLPSAEIDVFSWALGETWASTGFYEWDKIGFSFIDVAALKKIVNIAQEVLEHKKLGSAGFKEIHKILNDLRK